MRLVCKSSSFSAGNRQYKDVIHKLIFHSDKGNPSAIRRKSRCNIADNIHIWIGQAKLLSIQYDSRIFAPDLLRLTAPRQRRILCCSFHFLGFGTIIYRDDDPLPACCATIFQIFPAHKQHCSTLCLQHLLFSA